MPGHHRDGEQGEPPLLTDQQGETGEGHQPEQDREPSGRRPRLQPQDAGQRRGPGDRLLHPLAGDHLQERAHGRDQEQAEGGGDRQAQQQEVTQVPPEIPPLHQRVHRREEEWRRDDRPRPEVEPDRQRAEEDIGAAGPPGTAPPPRLERHHGAEGEEDHRHVGAGDAAVEDERRRDRQQPAVDEDGPPIQRVQAPCERRRQSEQRRQAAEEDRQPQEHLRQRHPPEHEQLVESRQRDAVVGHLVGDEDLRQGKIQRRPDGVGLVPAEDLVGEVPQAQRRPGHEGSGGPEAKIRYFPRR